MSLYKWICPECGKMFEQDTPRGIEASKNNHSRKHEPEPPTLTRQGKPRQKAAAYAGKRPASQVWKREQRGPTKEIVYKPLDEIVI